MPSTLNKTPTPRSSPTSTKASAAGRFLTLEGSEGVGKTTNLHVIEAHLRARGVDLVVTREPGGTALGERLRRVLLDVAADQGEPPMVDMAELLLMFAARAQHVAQVIRPALEAGLWVLSDRFTDASFAYQGGGRGLSMTTIATLETLVQNDLRPDQTIYLDIDPHIAFKRIADREHDRIEREQMDFFQRVRACYLARAAAEPERFCVIDAGLAPDAVAEQIVEELDRRLGDWLPDASGAKPS